MKTTITTPTSISATARVLFATLLLLPLTSLVRAQTAHPIHTDTTLTPIVAGAATSDRAVNTSIDYIVDDNVTLTFKNTGRVASGAANYGTIFAATTTGPHAFMVTQAGANNTGSVVFDGGASADAPSFAATGLGGAFYMATGNNSLTIIGGATPQTTGTIQNFWGVGNGAVLYLGTQGTNTALLQNLVAAGNGNVNTQSSVTFGGLILDAGANSSLTLNNVSFVSNTNAETTATNVYGGILYVGTNATATGTNLAFVNNTGSTSSYGIYGGVIFLGAASGVNLSNIYFSGNTNMAGSTARGGAIYISTADSTVLTSATFANNSVAGPRLNEGGALWINNSTDPDLTINGGLFISNSAAGGTTNNGGAIYAGTSANVTLTNVDFTTNVATTNGGAICVAGTTGLPIELALNNGTFTGNSAGGSGGAIWLSTSATLTLNDVTFTNNTAVTNGGALLATATARVTYNVTHDITNAGNTAASGGFLFVSNQSIFNVNIAPNVTLTIGSAADTTADSIAGANCIININADAGYSGTLVLHADSSALSLSSGTVNVAAGTLLMGNPQAAIGGNTVIIQSGARAGGLGTLGAPNASHSLIVNTGATLQVGLTHTESGTLTVGNLTLAAGSILDYGIYGGTDSDQLLLMGAITQDSLGASIINVSATTSGTYAIINASASSSGSANITNIDTSLFNVSFNGSLLDPADYFFRASTSDTDNFLYLLIGAPPDNNILYWTGAAGDTSWLGANWKTATLTSANFTQGDIINLDGSNDPANATLNIDTPASATVAGMFVSGNQNYTITGAGIIADATVGTFATATAATGQLTLGAKAADDASTVDQAAAYTGTLTLNNAANTFTKGIVINSGALVGNDQTLGVGPGAGIAIAAPGSLTFDQIADATYTAPISGDGLLVKENTGNLTLDADNSAFTGATNINAGALTLATADTVLGGLVNLAPGATLAGSGTLTGSVIATAGGGTIIIGANGAAGETLTIGGTLALGPGDILQFNNAAGSISDLLQLGALSTTGTSTIDLTSAASGTYALINATAGLAASATASFLTTINGATPSGRSAADYFITGNDLYLTFVTTNITGLKWDGGVNGTWDQISTANWTGADDHFLNGDSITFDDTAAGTHNVVLAASIDAADILVNTGSAYTFTGSGAITTSTLGTSLATGITGALTKEGPGTLILANTGDNDFEGGINIISGTVQGNAATLGVGASAAIANNGAFVFDQSTDATYAAAITGAGALVKQSAGALTLSNAANTYTGGINVAAGILALTALGATTQGAINIASAASLRITNAASYTIQNTLTGAGTLDIALASPAGAVNFTSAAGSAFSGTVALGASTFNLNATNAAALANATLQLNAGNITTVASALQPFSLAALSLNGGELRFSATVPPDTAAAGIIQTGALALNSGTVQISIPTGGSSMANPPPAGGANLLTQDDGTAFTHLITAATVTGNAANIALVDQTGNPIAGSSVDINEAGATVATGTYTYKLTAAANGLNVNYALSSLTISDGQTLHIAPDAGATGPAATLSATVSGNGNLSIDAASAPVTLAAVNNYTGATTITSGTLIAGASNALGNTSALNMAALATFDLAGNSQTVGTLTTASTSTLNLNSGQLVVLSGGSIDGILAGAGTLNITGGTLAITAANTTLTAVTNIAAGATATLGNTAALGTGAINLQDATSALTLANTSPGAFANSITGTGILNLNGSALTTLASANPAFAGQTNVNGPVSASNLAALGASAINIGSTGNLTYTASGTLANSIAGAGALNLAATALTLTGSNTVASINALAGSNITAATANSLGNASTKLTMTDATVTLAQNNITLGAVSMNGASTLAFAGALPLAATATLSSLASTGAASTLAFNTNIGAGIANTLNVTGAVTGTYNIAFANTGNAPTAATTNINLIKAATNTATYLGSGVFTFNDSPNAFNYTINSAAGGATLDVTRGKLAPTGGAIVANASGAMPLTWFAELDTLEKRLGDLHLDTRATSGPDIWLRGYTQRLNVNTKDTPVAFNEDQYGTEVGLDYGGRQAGYATYIGVFIGYGSADRTIENMDASGHTTSVYVGAYFTWVTTDGWYVDALAKYNNFKNNISATSLNGSMNADYTNNALGGSIEAGKRFELGHNWYITPNAQAAMTAITAARYTTDTNMSVDMASTTSRQVRAGALIARKYAINGGQILQPYAKLYGAYQWTSNGAVIVDDLDCGAPQIKGARLDAGVGVSWKATQALQVYFDYECAWANDYQKPYGLTLGASYAW